jgi:hypothetical protein
MKGFEPPSPDVKELPAADIRVSSKGGKDDLVLDQTFPIRPSETDLNEFIVPVRASILTRCRNKLSRVTKGKPPFRELSLAICTLALGATLGAIPAGIKPGTHMYFFYFNFLPVVTAASGVAYFFLRREEMSEPAEIATEILNDLPDPNKIPSGESQK